MIADAACCIDAIEDDLNLEGLRLGLRGEPVSAQPGPLAGRTIVLGVSGSIAAYKSVEVTSRLVQAGATVEVVMTEAATRFVGPLTFRGITGNEPFGRPLGDGRAARRAARRARPQRRPLPDRARQRLDESRGSRTGSPTTSSR